MNAVKNTAARVINLCLACRLQLIPEPPLNDEQIECVAETILAAIDYAAALDQDRRPQRSRTITENIIVHSWKQADERSRSMACFLMMQSCADRGIHV